MSILVWISQIYDFSLILLDNSYRFICKKNSILIQFGLCHHGCDFLNARLLHCYLIRMGGPVRKQQKHFGITEVSSPQPETWEWDSPSDGGDGDHSFSKWTEEVSELDQEEMWPLLGPSIKSASFKRVLMRNKKKKNISVNAGHLHHSLELFLKIFSW